MSTQTPNYGLEKPAQTDIYDVDVFNGNMDVVDAELSERLPMVLLTEVGADLDACTNGVYLHNGPSVTGSMSEVQNAPKETNQPFVLKSYIWERGVHTGGAYPQTLTNGKQTLEYADGDVYERYKAGVFSGTWFPWRLISQNGAQVDTLRVRPLTQSVRYCVEPGYYIYDNSVPYSSYRIQADEEELPYESTGFILEVQRVDSRVYLGAWITCVRYTLQYVGSAVARYTFTVQRIELNKLPFFNPRWLWRSMEGENPTGHIHTKFEAPIEITSPEHSETFKIGLEKRAGDIGPSLTISSPQQQEDRLRAYLGSRRILTTSDKDDLQASISTWKSQNMVYYCVVRYYIYVSVSVTPHEVVLPQNFKWGYTFITSHMLYTGDGAGGWGDVPSALTTPILYKHNTDEVRLAIHKNPDMADRAHHERLLIICIPPENVNYTDLGPERAP